MMQEFERNIKNDRQLDEFEDYSRQMLKTLEMN
jgi:hypothetical protein